MLFHGVALAAVLEQHSMRFVRCVRSLSDYGGDLVGIEHFRALEELRLDEPSTKVITSESESYSNTSCELVCQDCGRFTSYRTSLTT